MMLSDKWENAFNPPAAPAPNMPPPPPPPTLKNGFLDLDPDRFVIRVTDKTTVTDLTPNVETQTVRVVTSSDDGNIVTLTETGGNTGVFVSKALLLMANTVDDIEPIDTIQDNQPNDRTFMVKLGDNVSFNYANLIEKRETVPVVKVVKLHVNILRDKKMADGGVAVVAQAVAEGYVAKANEIYAQVGIRFAATYITVDPPTDAGVDLSDGLTENEGKADLQGKLIMSDEEKALLGDTGVAKLRTTALDDIEVYFVNYLAPKDNKTQGESFTAALVPAGKYNDSVILSSDAMVYTTLAHEIGHVLMDRMGHPNGNFGVQGANLMANPFHVSGGVGDSRRINSVQTSVVSLDRQAQAMLANRPVLLTRP